MILGDFHVRIGQGLSIWQGYGMYRDIGLNLFKQSATISPYASSTENNYMQGIALNKKIKQLDFTSFFSRNKIDVNLETIQTESFIKSFKIDGLHQTEKDLLTRKNIF